MQQHSLSNSANGRCPHYLILPQGEGAEPPLLSKCSSPPPPPLLGIQPRLSAQDIAAHSLVCDDHSPTLGRLPILF